MQRRVRVAVNGYGEICKRVAQAVTMQNALRRSRRRPAKFILQGGEAHAATRVVSCNTTSVVRTLTALKRAGLLRRARGTLLRRATDLQHWSVQMTRNAGHDEVIDAFRRPSRIALIRNDDGIVEDAHASIGTTNAALPLATVLI